MKKHDPNSPFCQRWLPRKKAAALIGVTVRAMEDWHRKGIGPEFFKRNARVGGYHLTVIEEFIRDREQRRHHADNRVSDQGTGGDKKDCDDD